MAVASTGVSARRRRHIPASFDRVSFIAVFLVVPLAVFLVFVISPYAQAMYFALTNWSGFSSTMSFIGLENFTRAFTDNDFLRSFGNSLLLAVTVPLVTIVVALFIASLVTVSGSDRGTIRGIAGRNLYRSISFFPYAIPAVVIGLIWSKVFDPTAGILNGFLTSIGLTGFKNFAWLGDQRTAMPVSMFVIVWAFIGFYTVLFVAGIKGIPAELYEAARLDGAGHMRTAWSVTLPGIRDNIQTAYIYLGITAMDSFAFMQVLNPEGGPNLSTRVISQELFITAFSGTNRFGYATAMGVIFAAAALLFAAVIFGVNRLVGRGGLRAASRRTTPPGESA